VNAVLLYFRHLCPAGFLWSPEVVVFRAAFQHRRKMSLEARWLDFQSEFVEVLTMSEIQKATNRSFT